MSVFNLDEPQEAPAERASSVFDLAELSPAPTRAVAPEKPKDAQAPSYASYATLKPGVSLKELIGLPVRGVKAAIKPIQTAVGAAGQAIEGASGEALFPSGGSADPSQIIPDLMDARRGSLLDRLQVASQRGTEFVSRSIPLLAVPVGVTSVAGLPVPRMFSLGSADQALRSLRSTGKGKAAAALEAAGQTVGSMGGEMAIDPVTYAPIGALGKAGKVGSLALRGISGAFSVQAGVNAVTGLDEAYRLFREAKYNVTPEVASKFAEVAVSGVMSIFAGAAAAFGHGASPEITTKIDEMRQAALKEKMDAVAEGRDPSPASVDVIGKIRELDLATMRARALKIPKKEVPGVVIEDVVRLYRGVRKSPVSGAAAAGQEGTSVGSGFTPNIELASKYAEGGHIVSVDVPRALLPGWKPKNPEYLVPPGQEMKFGEYNVPEEIAKAAKVVEPEGPPVPKFIRPALSRPGEPVLVDVELLDRAWAGSESNAGYVPATEITPRETMYSTIDKGHAIEMPEVRLGTDGSFVFGDGRQRFAALRDLGVKQIKVWVPKEDAALIRDRYTSGETPVPLAEMPPFEELGWKGFEAANDMPASVYVSRLPKTPSPETPFKPVFKPQPGKEGGTASAAYRLTHDIFQIVKKIDPEAEYMLGGLVSTREHLQAQAAYRVGEAGKLLTKEQQSTARLDMDGKSRAELSGGHAELGKFLDDLWQLGQETPEVADRLQRLGIPREENYVPRIPKEPITEAQKLKKFAEKLQRDAADNGTTLSEEDALAGAYRDKSAALRYVDTTNALHLAGALEHARTGALDAPLKDGLDAFYSHGSRVAEHIAEMKWLGPQREKLQAILSRVGRPLSAAEAVGMTPEQFASVNAQRATNAKVVENAFDIVMGKDYGTFGKVISRAQRVTALVVMVKSLPKQMTTIFNTVAWNGIGPTTVSTMRRFFGGLKTLEDNARRSGATWPNESGEFGNQYGSGAGYIHGVNWADKQMRMIANDAAFPTFKAATKGDRTAIAQLETQGYFREAEYRGIPREKALEMTQENIDIAGKTSTDFSQLRADAYNLSPWMDTPLGRMSTQLIRFNINMGKFAWRAGTHAIKNRDVGVFVRLVPAVLAAGASSMTIGSILKRFGVTWSEDARIQANTVIQWRKDPEAFFNKLFSSRPIPWDRKHPETIVASLIQMLAASGSMGGYQTFIERTLGSPEDFAGVTFQKAYDLVASAQTALKGGLGEAVGNPEFRNKKLKSAAKEALGTMGPIGGEIAQEFFGEAGKLPLEAGFFGWIHQAIDPTVKVERAAQRKLSADQNIKSFQDLSTNASMVASGHSKVANVSKPTAEKDAKVVLDTLDLEAMDRLFEMSKRFPSAPGVALREAGRLSVERQKFLVATGQWSSYMDPAEYVTRLRSPKLVRPGQVAPPPKTKNPARDVDGAAEKFRAALGTYGLKE